MPPLAANARKEIDQRVPCAGSARTRFSPLALNRTLANPTCSWMPLASFIKLDLLTFNPAGRPAREICAQYAKATLIAEKVETAEQFKMMSGPGREALFQGFWFAPGPGQNHPSIAKATIIQLISLVRKQAGHQRDRRSAPRKGPILFNLLHQSLLGFGLSCEPPSAMR